MAYGLKYFAKYQDVAGTLREVRFLKDGYAGPVTEWLTMSGSAVRDQGSSDAMFGNMIVTSQARINLFLKEQYDLTDFVYDRRTFMCQLLIVGVGGGEDKVVWTGWVEPWNAARQWQKPPYQVSLLASCGLAHLSKKKYVNPDNTFKKTGLKIIRECLALTGLELDLRVSSHMYENSWAGDKRLGLNSFEINTARYYDQNGEALKCDEIIQDILNKRNVELAQWDNRWTIRAIVDNAADLDRTYLEIPFIDGGELKPAAPWPGAYLINDEDAFSIDGGQIRVLAPITKYRTEVDMGPQTPYFENGNMVLWTNDGLAGWDFSHMPKGNPGWEQYHIGGDPEAASVLKINGIAPGPYQKKRKKSLGQILGQVAAVLIAPFPGTITPNNSNKFYDVEPTEYIETSVGRVSPGDKVITISFDYETAPFSGNVIIALRMPHAYKPDVTFWTFPLQETQYSTEFRFIIVPAINRENLIGKAHIDVGSNPNYPDGSVVGWTYVATGVPDGQVRRIGGVAGVAVENGDLIVSKISNPGGTQAAVGSSWEVINLRTNVKKGTFELPLHFEAANKAQPIPVEEIFIRFYKISHEDGKTGDWYKVYNLRGTLEGFVASDDASKYATTLERGSRTDEEAEVIKLLTGDYNPWFSGSTTKPGGNEPTNSWRRREDLNESLSIYRAMMLDRLCMTSRPLIVAEGEIFLRNDANDLSYFHTLLLNDMSNKRMRIVRYSLDDYLRTVKVTAIEVKHEEIPAEELRQDSYIPGSRILNTIPGQGDGVYPTKQDSSGGRLSAELPTPTSNEVEDSVSSSGRLGAMFDFTEGGLEFVVGEEGEDSLDLATRLSEAFTDLNDDQEDDDIFDPLTLVWTLSEKPTWVSEVEIADLVITAAATPPKKGTYYIFYDVLDPDSGLEFEVRIPILATPTEAYAESWPPTFDEIELIFTVGEESTQEALLTEYMDEEHAVAEGYSFRLITPVEWMTDRSIVNMNLAVTGKPTAVGSWQMVWEIKDAIGQRDIFYVTLTAIAAAIVTASAVDTTDSDVILGVIPGSFALTEEITAFDVAFTIDGKHTGYIAALKGGGPLGDSIDVTRDVDFAEADGGTYYIFPPGGTPAEIGQYTLTVIPKRGDTLSTPSKFGMTFYDEEYFSQLTGWFYSGGIELAFLNPNGTSVFESDGIEIWELESRTDGVAPDEVIQNLYNDSGAIVATKTHPYAVDGKYKLDDTPVLRDPGKYVLETILLDTGDPFIARSWPFEVTGPSDGKDGECCSPGYRVNFGDGVNTNYILTHGLNSKDLQVEFFQNSDGSEIDVAFRCVDLDSIEVGFSARCIPTVNEIRALIWKR